MLLVSGQSRFERSLQHLMGLLIRKRLVRSLRFEKKV